MPSWTFASASVVYIDAAMRSALPPWITLLLWGVFIGALSTVIYHLLAPRERIEHLRARGAAIRIQLKTISPDNSSFTSALSLSARAIGIAFTELALVTGPVVAASLPALLVISCVEAAYADTFPHVGFIRGWEVLLMLSALAANLSFRKVLR